MEILRRKQKLFQKFLLTSLMCLLGSAIYAQYTVNGTVRNEKGEPLPGVNIVLKGTSTGTITDLTGKYSIEVSGENDVLVFSFVGFQTKEQVVGKATLLDLQLVPDIASLEEVIIIGYGTREKVNLTGSISSINTENLDLNPVGNITQALQGAAAGINVSTSNTPGSNASIRIRGLGTINNNSPLWIIDGVPITGGLEDISPSDIQSISILKDAVSTAIYGARGANGVILVSTIKGKQNQAPKIEYDVRYGLIKNSRRYEMLNVKEHGELLWLEAKNSGVEPSHPMYGSGTEPHIPKYLIPVGADQADLGQYNISSYPITEANPEGTDWYDEIYNPGVTQQHNLSITGGSENITYGLGAGFLNEEGMVILTGFKRYTLRSNISAKLNDWLELGQSFGLSHTNDWGYQDEGGPNSAFGQLLELSAIMPVYDIMGNYAPVSRMTGLNANNNPIARAHRRQDETRQNLGIRGNAYVNMSFLENFSFKSLFGLDFANYHGKSPLEPNPDSYSPRPYAELTEYYNEKRQWNWTNTITYSTAFANNHKLELLLGTEAISNEGQDISGTRNQFFLMNENYWVLNAGEGEMRNTGSANEWSVFSYFGRLHYELDDKYIIDATLRRDGSSRFGKESRYGTFPALALGWRISEENFLSTSGNWLNYLKIRASWGQAGNDQIGNYNGFTYYNSHKDFSYYPITGQNNSIVRGFELSAFGNPNAKWETITSINFGLDATLFDHIDLTVDVWQRNTKDMLYPKTIPFVYGRGNVPSVNVGDMKNTGFDAQLSFHGSGLNNELRYDVTANVSHYKNKLIKLSDNEEMIIGGSIREQYYTRTETGTSFPQFFGYEVLGIFQTEEEANNHPAAFGQNGTYNKPGHFKYRDVNGDNVIDDNDRTYIGNPHPDFTTGLLANIQYKRFNLTASLYASIGNDLLNLARRSLDFNLFQRNRSTRRLYESWGSPYLEDNRDAKMPMAEINDSGSQQPSSYYVEDGSFLRLQSVQLGYNLPERVVNAISISRLHVYIMATNLFTITNYSGLDPLIQTSGPNFGIDLGMWPAPQRFLLGINVNF